MSQPERITRDYLDKIVVANINEFGWHCVNVIEDDGHPPWSILRLAGLFVPLALRYPCFAAVQPSGPCLGVRRHAAHPCTRPAPGAQRRDSGPPHGLRPLSLPCDKEIP
jgi:hypothetical protein